MFRTSEGVSGSAWFGSSESGEGSWSEERVGVDELKIEDEEAGWEGEDGASMRA